MNRKILTSLLIVFVSLGLLTGATCHGKTSPRHDATTNLTMLVSGLRGLQAGEQTLYQAKTVPQLTAAAHKSFNAKMLQVWDATDAAVVVAQTWQPGEPVPSQLGAMLEKVRVAVEEATAVFGAALPQEISDIWKAVAQLLLPGGVTP